MNEKTTTTLRATLTDQQVAELLSLCRIGLADMRHVETLRIQAEVGRVVIEAMRAQGFQIDYDGRDVGYFALDLSTDRQVQQATTEMVKLVQTIGRIVAYHVLLKKVGE